ncbi:MAG: hypothetical protein R3B84_16855 [Zavarzinella sp.]
MSQFFPCPNPQCDYPFDSNVLPPAAMVTCPKCATRFPYRAGFPIPTMEQLQAPVGSPGGQVPVAGFAAPAPGATAPASTGERPVVNYATGRRMNNALLTGLLVGGFTLFLVLAIVGFLIFNKKGTDFFGPTPFRDERLNFTFKGFDSGWEEDAQLRESLQLNIFLRKKAGANAWIGMYAHDFDTREPRPNELRAQIDRRLRTRFKNTLETREVPGLTWGGQPAIAIEFSANYDTTPEIADEESKTFLSCRGEVYAMTYKGVAYLLIFWGDAKDWDSLKPELVQVRSRFELGKFREKWKPQQLSTITYTDPKDRFTITDQNEIWRMGRSPDDPEQKGPRKGNAIRNDYYILPKEIDPAGIMCFRAIKKFLDKGGNESGRTDVKALVVELPNTGDPLASAKNHVLERIRRDYPEGTENLTLEDANSPNEIELPSDGELKIGRFLFRDPLSRDDKTYWIIAARVVGDKTIAVEIDVPEKYALPVEEWMVNFASSLQPK